MNNKKLNERLRAANPVPSKSQPGRARKSVLQRAFQTLAVVLSASVIGVGVTWAATGENPITSAFTKDLRVEESDTGLDSFSLLRPMTQEALEGLPPRVARHVSFQATSRTVQRNLERGLPPFGHPKPTRKNPFRPDPAMISAIGQGTTNEGNDFTMMVIDEELCLFVSGSGNCNSIESLEKGPAIGGGSEYRDSGLYRVYGLVNDEVTAIRVGNSATPITVPQNVFELRNLPPEDIRIVGLDDEGNEVFREKVEISFWAAG